MIVHTRSQKLAQAAFPCVQQRKTSSGFDDYKSFAKQFPALIHTCGLAQAVAFALAKEHTAYIDDLAAVLKAGEHQEILDGKTLNEQSRTQPLSVYIRLTRDAINAASWLKRYAEAAAGEES